MSNNNYRKSVEKQDANNHIQQGKIKNKVLNNFTDEENENQSYNFSNSDASQILKGGDNNNRE